MKTLAAVIVACVALVGVRGCDLPPSLWCSSIELAKQCGVYDQCAHSLRTDPGAGPVNMTLYYESLCPDCRRFFSTQLYKTWKALNGSAVVNLTLVPYGNAREKQDPFGKWIFQCQHGQQECIGNLIDACSIEILKDINVYFPFIYCMEGKSVDPASAAKECASSMGIDLDPIMTCASGDMGNKLEHEMALQTNALNPPHQYVPWVTINGVHTEKMEREAERDLLSLLCETYKGPTPSACQQHHASGYHRN